MKKFELLCEDNTKLYLRAKTKLEALQKAKKRGLKLKELSEFTPKSKNAKRLKTQKLALVFHQLAILLDAGLSLQVASSKLYETMSDKEIKNFLFVLENSLRSGQKLSLAFENTSLEKSDIALISIGENTGKLALIFEQLAKAKEKRLKNAKRIKKALSYPCFVFCVLIISFCALILFVIPAFEQIFMDFKADLPLITRLILALYEILNTYFLFLIGTILGFVLVFALLYAKIFAFRYLIHRLLILCFKKFIIASEFMNFFALFSLLIQNGLHLLKALDLSREALRNEFLRSKIAKLKSMCEAGLDIHEAFKQSKLLDSLVLSMLSTAMLSSSLALMNKKIALYYEDKQKAMIEAFIALLEPVMTLFVALLVLFLALGIFLPMWELNALIAL